MENGNLGGKNGNHRARTRSARTLRGVFDVPTSGHTIIEISPKQLLNPSTIEAMDAVVCLLVRGQFVSPNVRNHNMDTAFVGPVMLTNLKIKKKGP